MWPELEYAVCPSPSTMELSHPPLTYLMIRLGDFRLHRHVYKRTQGHVRTRTQAIASREDLDPRLDDLFLYNADVQHRHVDVRGYGEGESEELSSSVRVFVLIYFVKKKTLTLALSYAFFFFLCRAPTVWVSFTGSISRFSR